MKATITITVETDSGPVSITREVDLSIADWNLDLIDELEDVSSELVSLVEDEDDED